MTADQQAYLPDHATFGVCFKQICHVQYHRPKTPRASTHQVPHIARTSKNAARHTKKGQYSKGSHSFEKDLYRWLDGVAVAMPGRARGARVPLPVRAVRRAIPVPGAALPGESAALPPSVERPDVSFGCIGEDRVIGGEE